MNQSSLHFRTQKSREQVVDRFCKLIVILAISLAVVYLVFHLKMLAVVSASVAALFSAFIYFNKKTKGASFRASIIIASIVCVLVFSLLLGFNSGIYLYLFVAPFLTYLLYGYNEVKQVVLVFIAYVVTFVSIYLMEKFGVKPFYSLHPDTLYWIYSYNLGSTFMLSFSIVTYFAATNFHFIEGLKAHHIELEEQMVKREESERLARQTLRDREELLAEIHHRVKNNLALITSLINLQVNDAIQEGKTGGNEYLITTRNRIYAIALVHNLIYQNKSIDQVDFDHFITEFFNELKKDHTSLQNVQVRKNVDPNCQIDLGIAVPLALIFNELAGNCILGLSKSVEDAVIEVNLQLKDNKQIYFSVGSKTRTENSDACNFDRISLLILEALSEQLDGVLTFPTDENHQFSLVFPLPTS